MPRYPFDLYFQSRVAGNFYMSTIYCKPSTGQESDWSILYESAFPLDERMPTADVQAMIAGNTMLLHRTLNSAGELLCFSLVNPMSNFSLLAYIATDTTKRSSGVGSKHMKELLIILKNTYQATHLGLFLEIESTKEASLSANEATDRKRRLAFYQRLQCKRLCGKDYFLPSYGQGLTHKAGELLWFEYGNAIDKDATISQVIAEIYTRGYGIAPGHATYVQVMAQFTNASSTGQYDNTCPVVPAALPVTVIPAVPVAPVVTVAPVVPVVPETTSPQDQPATISSTAGLVNGS